MMRQSTHSQGGQPGSAVTFLCVWLTVASMIALAVGLPVSASGQVTVIVMPMEHPKKDVSRFTVDDYKKDHPNLEIENTSPGEWEKLRIGHHRWLCGELQGLASKADQVVHLRFLSWEQHPFEDLTVTYKGRYDVCQVPSTWTAALIQKGILAECGDLFDPNNYPKQLLKTCHIHGQKSYYAVPWHIDFRVIYFSDRLTQDPDELIDFDGFKRCLADRKARMGIGKTRNEWDLLHGPLNWAFAGQIVERRNDQWVAVFTEPRPMAGLRRIWELKKEGLVRFVEADRGRREQEWMTLAREVREGKHDVVIGGPYMRVAFSDRPDIKAAPLPRMISRQDHTFLGGSHLGLTTAKRTPQEEKLAKAIIRHLTSTKAAIALYRNTDAMPAHKAAFAQFLKENSLWEAFSVARDSGKPYPSLPEWAEGVEIEVGSGIFHNVINSIATGRNWDKDILPQLTKAAEKVTKALNPPPIWPWILLGLTVTAVLAAFFLYLLRREQRIRREQRDLLHQVRDQADKTREALETVKNAVRSEVGGIVEKARGDLESKLGLISLTVDSISQVVDGLTSPDEEDVDVQDWQSVNEQC